MECICLINEWYGDTRFKEVLIEISLTQDVDVVVLDDFMCGGGGDMYGECV